MNMYLFFTLTFLAILISGCGKKSPEYFQKRGESIIQELIIDLQKIDDVEDFPQAQLALQAHFDALVDVMIEARKWQMKTKQRIQVPQASPMSQHLILEFNRLSRNPLSRHFLEKCQQPALEKLDAFEKKYQLILQS